MPVPLLQFQAHNPIDTALQAALGTYKGLGQGQYMRTENQLNQAKLPYAERMAQEEYMAKELANRREQAELPYAERRLESDINYKNASADLNRQKVSDPLLGTAGAKGSLAAYNYYKGKGDPNADLIMQDVINQTTKKGMNAQMWRGLPMDTKSEILGRTNANGIDPLYALQRFGEGATFEDLLTEKGIPIDEGYAKAPLYSPTGAVRTTTQKRQAAGAELNVFTDFIDDAMGKYVDIGSVNGLSIPLIMDQLTGANEDDQAKFWAAYALYPEENYVRMQVAQGNAGITALKHMEERALGNISGLQSMIRGPVWKKSQKILKQKIQEGMKAYSSEALNPGRGAPKKSDKKIITIETLTPDEAENLSIEELKILDSGGQI